jgi:hypothetical protein
MEATTSLATHLPGAIEPLRASAEHAAAQLVSPLGRGDVLSRPGEDDLVSHPMMRGMS